MKIIISFVSKEVQGKKVAYPHRLKTIIGNWKMNKTIAEAVSFASKLSLNSYSCQVGLAVPFTMIKDTAAFASKKLLIGAQNVAGFKDGPYTGEVSCSMLKDAGASFAIIGHSERRTFFQETNKTINNKANLLIESGLKPLICIGESESEHVALKTQDALQIQLNECLKGISSENIAEIIIAYEPLWAIGTGKAATAENVQTVHAFCRNVIAKLFGDDVAAKIILLYGGSVKADNAKGLVNLEDVDGLLVGGSSLEFETFDKILTTIKN